MVQVRYYRLKNRDGEIFLGVEQMEGEVILVNSLSSFSELASIAWVLGKNIDDVADLIVAAKDYPSLKLDEIITSEEFRLIRPIDPPEVWAAGVTYQSSKREREEESAFAARCYTAVYEAERPEVFFKATATRCVGPFEEIGIRGDSRWNVPEPELAFVLYKGMIVGYTIGNDVSSRSIESENPLYLPQAKIYARCCAIGPCISSTRTIPDPHTLTISCSILRKGKVIFRGETSTAQMVRSCNELASYVLRHNPVPDFTVVLTGTGIIPPPDFSLLPGDVVQIMIERIGILENVAIQV